MPAFNSMIFVQRGLAPMPAVEKAIARQVLHGGDLTTNVLEVCSVDEAKLAVVLSEIFGLPAAPAGKLSAPDASVLATVPGELALAHNIFPLSVSGEVLTIATLEPLSVGVQGDLASRFDMDIRQMLSPLIRIRQAIADHYGLPLERRFARLLAKIESRPAADPSVLPAPVRRADLPSSHPSAPPPATDVAPQADVPARVVPQADVSAPVAEQADVPARVAPQADVSAPVEPQADVPAPVAEQADVPARVEPQADVPAPPAHVLAEPAPEVADVPETPPEVDVAPRDPVAAAPTTSDRPPPPAGPVRRKGPLTAVMAEQDLAQAKSADEVLGIFFAFAQQYFDYSAVFVVHGDVAQGSDASGPGADRATLKGITVALRSSSVLSRAYEQRSPIVGWLEADGVDGELARQLRRRPLASGELGRVAIVPIVVRARVVALVYGDDGSADVALGAIGDVLAVAAVVGGAIERVILQRKQRAAASAEQASGSGKVMAPSDPPQASSSAVRRQQQAGGGVATLARVVGAPQGQDSAPGRGTTSSAEPERAEKPPGAQDVVSHEEEPPASGAEHEADAVGDASANRRANASSLGRRAEGAVLTSSPLPDESPPNATSASVDPSESAVAPAARRSAGAPQAGVNHAQLVQYVIEGGAMFDDAFAELVKGGEASMPAAIAAFPGPVQVDRHRARDIPRASQCGPLLALIARIGRPAVPFLTLRATAGDVEARFWVTHLFGELCYPEAANALVPRLFDDDASVRRIARRSAAHLGLTWATAAPIVMALEEVIKNRDERTARRVMAIEAIADMRPTSVIPELIRAVRESTDQIVSAARRALTVITGQDLGREALQWSDWWAKNAKRHRIEWLIDALVHEQPSIRRVAGEELKQITKENFGFYDDLPLAEREQVQRRAREWWEREGRARFD